MCASYLLHNDIKYWTFSISETPFFYLVCQVANNSKGFIYPHSLVPFARIHEVVLRWSADKSRGLFDHIVRIIRLKLEVRFRHRLKSSMDSLLGLERWLGS